MTATGHFGQSHLYQFLLRPILLGPIVRRPSPGQSRLRPKTKFPKKEKCRPKDIQAKIVQTNVPGHCPIIWNLITLTDPPLPDPPPQNPLPQTPPNFALFSLSCRIFLSRKEEGGSSRGILACRPLGLAENDPREAQTCNLGGPWPRPVARIPREDFPERDKTKKMGRETEKTAKMLPPSTLRPPPFGPPPPFALAPFGPPPFGAPPFGLPPFASPPDPQPDPLPSTQKKWPEKRSDRKWA